jgi:hypothetical protein
MLISWLAYILSSLHAVAASSIGWGRGISQTLFEGPLTLIATLLS